MKSRELEFSVADDLDKLAATFLNDNTGGANNDPSSISNDNTFNDYDSYYYER